MEQYYIEDVVDRRVNEEDGSLEYSVQWAGFSTAAQTWEPRAQLTSCAAECVQAVDQTHMDATDGQLRRWRRQQWAGGPAKRRRGRTVLPAHPPLSESDDGAEVFQGLLWRSPAEPSSSSPASSNAGAPTEAAALLLGEVVLADDTSQALQNAPSRRRRRGWATSPGDTRITTAALNVERAWRESHGQSLLRSVDVARCSFPLKRHCRTRGSDAATARALSEEARRAAHIRIINIMPPQTARSGLPFATPVSMEPLIGAKDMEDLRLSIQVVSPLLSSVVQELAQPHVEQLVVRYRLESPETDSVATTGRSKEAEEPPLLDLPDAEACRGIVSSMPLSVFRVAFPQQLIDYLLDHSIVLQGSTPPGS